MCKFQGVQRSNRHLAKCANLLVWFCKAISAVSPIQPNRKRLLQMQFSALHIVGSKTELKCEIRWIPMTVWISSAGTCPRSPDPHSPNCQWQLKQLIRAQLVRIQCSNIAAEEWSSNISTTRGYTRYDNGIFQDANPFSTKIATEAVEDACVRNERDTTCWYTFTWPWPFPVIPKLIWLYQCRSRLSSNPTFKAHNFPVASTFLPAWTSFARSCN